MINLFNKTDDFIKSEKLKVKTLFCEKDLSCGNLFSKPHDFIKHDKLA